MSKKDGLKWAVKAYLILSLVVIVLIWGAFFISLFWGRLSHGPVEGNWTEEIMKWVVMTPVLILIVGGIFYPWIATVASRRANGIDESQKRKEKK